MWGGSKLVQNLDFSLKLMSGPKIVIHIQRFKSLSNSPLPSPLKVKMAFKILNDTPNQTHDPKDESLGYQLNGK